MSYHEYRLCQLLEKEDLPFGTLIMAAINKSDEESEGKLKKMFPEIWKDFRSRRTNKTGKLAGE